MKRKQGRPKLTPAVRQAKQTGVRLRSAERALLDMAAHQQELSLSDWMRKILIAAARRQLGARRWKMPGAAASRQAAEVRRHYARLAS